MTNFFSYSTAWGRLIALVLLVAAGPAGAQALVVTTAEPISVTETKAKLGGSVSTSSGVGERGIQYYLATQRDSTNVPNIPIFSTSASFNQDFTGFTSGLSYRVRAYAITASGPIYGRWVKFQTVPPAPFWRMPTEGSFVTTTTPTYTGDIESSGLVSVYVDAQPGNTTPTVSKFEQGAYSLTQPATSPLSQGPHVAYAVVKGTSPQASAPSKTVSFIVDTVPPTAAISTAVGQSGSSTSLQAIQFRVEFSEPVVNFDKTGVHVDNGTLSNFQGSGTTYTFTVALSGATPPTTTRISVLAGVAKDKAGLSNVATSFNLVYTPVFIPTITTAVPGEIIESSERQASSAILGGNVTSNGGAAITGRGVEIIRVDNSNFSTFSDKDYKNALRWEMGNGQGGYAQRVNQLQIGSFYYVRAYATNQAGTGYGSGVLFPTVGIAPPLQSPFNNHIFTSKRPSFTATPLMSDPIGIEYRFPYKVFFYIVDRSMKTVAKLPAPHDGNTYSATMNTDLADGQYTVYTTIKVGSASESTRSAGITFLVDTNPPRR